MGVGFLRWWPSIRAWSLVLSMHWLLVALEEGGTGCLLGLHQLLQALQHRQTQGLEPGGKHSQVDTLTLYGTGCGDGKQGKGAIYAWVGTHRVPDWLVSVTTCLPPKRGKSRAHSLWDHWLPEAVEQAFRRCQASKMNAAVSIPNTVQCGQEHAEVDRAQIQDEKPRIQA